MNKTSYKDKNDLLGKMLDYLSFEFTECYSLLVREIKKRETQSNNPYIISKGMNNLTDISTVMKLHESLLLVRRNNYIAKKLYMENVMCMLNDSIVLGLNSHVVLKICNTICASQHLEDVYESMKCSIQTVYRIHQCGTNENQTLIKNLWDGYNNNFEPLNIQCGQQHSIPVPADANNYCPQFTIDRFSSDVFNTMLPSNGHTVVYDSTQIFPEQININQSLVEPIMLWLNSKKLHNYKWFFMELSFNEIEEIREDNFDYFVSKVNKKPITIGAQKKICYETKFLRDRKPKCEQLILLLDLEVTPNELCKYITYVQDILVCPIPNNNNNNGDQIQTAIMLIMKKSLYQLLDKLSENRKYLFNSLLDTSINRYLMCTSMISRNLAFANDQVEEIIIFAEMLKNKFKNY